VIYEDVEALVGVLRDSPLLTELEVREGDRVIRLRRAPAAAGRRAAAPEPSTPEAAPSGVAIRDETAAGEPESAPVDHGVPTTRVRAELVGVFHPGRPAPVGVGDTVSAGQVVAQIEAMRLMNDCLAPSAGRVVAVFVEDGQPVEYGQALFEIAAE
jgi:acetyl-CoA carboxylase biotin carboxyl carrier protein